MVLRFRKKSLLIGIFFLCLIFNSISTPFSFINLVFSYLDEVIEIICFIYVLLHIKTKAFQEKSILVGIWLLFIIIGLFGSIIWGQQSIIAVLQDLFFTCSKFIIGYLAAYIFFYYNNTSLADGVLVPAKIITVILTFLSLHDLIFPAWFGAGDYRYFMYSQSLIFSHPTYLTHAATLLLLIFSYFHLIKKNNCLPYMLMSTYLIFVALRAKGLGFLIIFWIVYIYLEVFKAHNRYLIMIVGTICVAIFGYSAIDEYYLNTTRYSPRRIMLLDSIEIMRDRFPIGTGFASFGSPTAKQYYSPLYTQFGYSAYRGLNDSNGMFLSDNFWPCIFGEFGFAGVVAFIAIIVVFVRKAFEIFKKNIDTGFLLLMIIVYVLISSVAETSFFNPTSLLMFFLFAFIENCSHESQQINSN